MIRVLKDHKTGYERLRNYSTQDPMSTCKHSTVGKHKCQKSNMIRVLKAHKTGYERIKNYLYVN